MYEKNKVRFQLFRERLQLKAELVLAELGLFVTPHVRLDKRLFGTKIKLSVPGGLRISTAVHTDLGGFACLLRQSEEWIRSTMEKMGLRPLERFKHVMQKMAPDHINLPGIAKEANVSYYKEINENLSKGFVQNEQEILLVGPTDNFFNLSRVLSHRCQLFVIPYIKEELKKISAKTGFKYKQVKIKKSSSLWGSCSSQGNINLNYRLAFLPPHLSRHIMLHELVHLVYPGHKKNFRQAMEHFEPEHHLYDAELRSAGHYFPIWLGD